MNKKTFSLLLIFLISWKFNYSQISENIPPKSLLLDNIKNSNIPVYKCPKINIDSLSKIDLIEEKNGNKPWRFGYAIEVTLSTENSGKWTILENGDKIWRLKITSEQALSLNFIYSYYNIPENSYFHIYTPDYKNILGAYTNKNINPDNTFATAILPGKECILEYFEPADVPCKGKIEISSIIIGYKNVFEKIKNFGDSGSCNNNINCPEGSDWQIEKKSIAMIVTAGGTRLCTGALINNAKYDGTPYLLTAYHCLGGETSWIFYFNYESPNCNNINGPTNYTVQGCTRIAAKSESDFALLKLNNKPQNYFEVYYSGWQRNGLPSPYNTCIHHPKGDIKKITFDYDSCKLSRYMDNQGLPNSHWKISQWEDGTTESGSSGSPLFDYQHRIIGQLHGGWASCTSLTADFFGAFSMSWDYGTTPNTRLKDWLDPDNTGITQLDGLYFGNIQYNCDIELSRSFEKQNYYICNDSISPKVRIKNRGQKLIDSLIFIIQIDNIEQLRYTHYKQLGFNGIDDVTLPSFPISEGYHNINIKIYHPEDQNPTNDTLNYRFASSSTFVNLILNTDNYGNETSWKIFDSQGNVVFNKSGYGNRKTYNEIFCLLNECYTFVIYDSGHNGMYDGINGGYSLYQDTILLFSGNGFFSDSVTHNFCLINNKFDYNLNINKFNFNVYFEPSKNFLYVHSSSHLPYNIYIYNLTGQCIFSKESNKNLTIIDTHDFKRNYYLIIIKNETTVEYHKFIKL